ncbi:unnamed protein product, partial [Polarella glacialis]
VHAVSCWQPAEAALSSMESVNEAFKNFDLHGTGTMKRQEIIDILLSLDPTLTADVVCLFMSPQGSPGDEVSYSDFLSEVFMNVSTSLALSRAVSQMVAAVDALAVSSQLPTDPLAPAAKERMMANIFDMCDVGGDKEINKRELIKACKNHEEVAEFFQLPRIIRQEDGSRDKMEATFQAIDGDHSRSISWAEFHSFCMDLGALQSGSVAEAAELADAPKALGDAT